MAFKRKIILIISMTVPVILLLITIEVGLQWLEHSRIDARISKGDAFWKASATIHKKSDDNILVYELRPGAQSRREGVLIKINSDGFRDDEFTNNSQQKGKHVVVLGDSVAWGWGVKMSSAFPQLLEKKLLASGVPITVYNLAVDGYSTEQELRMLELHGMALRPDLIILNYVLNDPDTADGGLARYYKPDFMLLRLASRAMHRIQGILQGHADIKEYHQQIHSYYADQTRNQFQKLGYISKKNHIPVLVAVTPVFRFQAGLQAHDGSQYQHVDSPFNYQENAQLILPKMKFEPSANQFTDELIEKLPGE